MNSTHLVLLPSYNSGPRLRDVVTQVLARWQPVCVVIDGSTDGSAPPLLELARTEPALTVLVLPRNSGKGAAVLAGARHARERGFTHALVMDADGQHPAESIAPFMAASQRQPEALILGLPVFPDNMPAARRHGRKLSIALVHGELLGTAPMDPLFGFRVYPLQPLLDVLGPRRGGRRYDFDTEAAVRLVWAGLPACNLPAPVRYFSRAEGGVSHFHYVRDNLTLVWLHARLLTSLLFFRWPALLRHRRRWQTAATALVLLLAAALPGHAKDTDPLLRPENRLAPGAPAWRDLTEAFAHHPDTVADFTEQRLFSFRKEPVVLKGEVRVSVSHGLSLHYAAPENRTVIFDTKGLLMRTSAGDAPAPADARAAAATDALVRILSLDLTALEKDFELYGQREGAAWSLVLRPRTEAQRRGLDRIAVSGIDATIRHIEIHRSARLAVDIQIAAPRPPVPFTPDELRQFFRGSGAAR